MSTEFSKFLIDRAYTKYVNLKPGSVCDFEYLISILYSKFFYVEAKFCLAKLSRIRQLVGEYLDI